MSICRPYLLCLLLAVALPACQPAASPQRQATLVIAVPSDPVGLDPARNKAEPVGSEIILNLFDTLVAWAPPYFDQLEGRLAQHWSLSADGRRFSVGLRPNLRFQNGHVVDAEAVRLSLQRARSENPFLAASLKSISAIVVTGPLSLRIELNESTPTIAALLAQPQAAIVDVRALQPGRQPVGSGAFSLRRHTPDTDVVLERNDDYFRGPARLQRLVYRIIPDAATRRLELKYGGVDISPQLSQLATLAADDAALLRASGRIDVLSQPSQIVRQLEFNNLKTDSPVHDRRVREAMAWAVDYEGLVKHVLGDTVERVYGPLPVGSWAFDPALLAQAYHHDPQRARQLLQEAGYPPGTLKLRLYTYQGSLWSSVATFLQANLAEVGVQIDIRQEEFSLLRARHVAGDFDIVLDGRQPWYNDPDAHITIGYLSSLARSAMTFRMPDDPTLDRAIVGAAAETDPQVRKQRYFTLQRQLLERLPAVYLFSNKLVVFKRKEVQGLQFNSAPPLNEYWSVYKQEPVL